jgi:hypothetical protein
MVHPNKYDGRPYKEDKFVLRSYKEVQKKSGHIRKRHFFKGHAGKKLI